MANVQDHTAAVQELGVLLSFPYFWKPSKVCDFFKGARLCLQNEKDWTAFSEQLDTDPESEEALGGKSWKDKLPSEHYTIFITQFITGQVIKRTKRQPQPPDPTFVSTLWNTVRHYHVHWKDLSDEAKKTLGWKENINVEHFYAWYWSKHFPGLLPYLWKKVGQWGNCIANTSLTQYYPFPLPNTKNYPLDIAHFLTKFDTALFAHMAKGGIHSRYRRSDKLDKVVQFRVVPYNILAALIPSESSGVKIVVESNDVKIYWNGEDYAVPTVGINKHDCVLIALRSGENLKAFLQNLETFPKIDAMISNESLAKQTISVLETLYGAKFELYPITIADLHINDQVEEIEEIENTFVDLQSQKKSTLLKSLMSTEHIKNYVVGNLLNQILRHKKLSLFTGCGLPEMEELDKKLYQERQFFDISIVNANVFLIACKSTKFVVSNINFHEIQSLLEIIDQNSEEAKKILPKLAHIPARTALGQECSKAIFCTTSDMEIVRNDFKDFSAEKYKSFHFFKFHGNNTFQWFQTVGSIKSSELALYNAGRLRAFPNETLFLKSIEEKQKERVVVIADQPGMGKSLVLLNLAHKLTCTHADRLILFIEFNNFMQKLPSKFTKNEILDTLIKVFSFSEEDLAFLKSWNDSDVTQFTKVSEGERNTKIRIELLFDALDEVGYQYRESAIKLIQMISDELPFIRVWVTMREYMLDECYIKFGSLGYKLEPFSEQLQNQYITGYWSEYYKEKFGRDPFKEEKIHFLSYAKKCLNEFHKIVDTRIAGVPLQCRMIAEIYEEKALVPDSQDSLDSKEDYPLLNLYQQMLERKLEKYLMKPNVMISGSNPFKSSIKNNIENVLVYYSIKLLFHDNISTSYVDMLHGRLTKEKDKIALGHGIIRKTEPLLFMHRTFAEYLVALHLYKITMSLEAVTSRHDVLYQKFLSESVFKVSALKRVYHPVVCVFLHQLLNDGSKEEYKHISQLAHDTVLRIPSKLISMDLNHQLPLGFCRHKLAGLLMISNHRHKLLMWAFIYGRIDTMCEMLSSKWLTERFPLNLNETYEILDCEAPLFHRLVDGFTEINVIYKILTVGDFKRVIDKLVERGLTFNLITSRDSYGRTPILYMLDQFRTGLYRPLIHNIELHRCYVEQLKSNVTDMDTNGNTVLHLIFPWTKNNIFSINVAGMEVRYSRVLPDDSKVTTEYRQVVEYYLSLPKIKQRSYVNVANDLGDTPVFFAIRAFRENMASLLDIFEKHGANLNLQNENGNSLLHWSINENLKVDFICKLLKCNVFVNAKNRQGKTALHLAVEKQQLDIVKVLIEQFEANVKEKDCENKTVFDYSSSEEVRDYLKTKHLLP